MDCEVQSGTALKAAKASVNASGTVATFTVNGYSVTLSAYAYEFVVKDPYATYNLSDFNTALTVAVYK